VSAEWTRHFRFSSYRARMRGRRRAGAGSPAAFCVPGTHRYLTSVVEIPQVSSHIEPPGEPPSFKSTDSKLTSTQLRGEIRHMDCVDCHNRAGPHVFQRRSGDAVSSARYGHITPRCPSFTREALAALASLMTRMRNNRPEVPAREIESRLNNFYRPNHAQLFQTEFPQVQAAGQPGWAVGPVLSTAPHMSPPKLKPPTGGTYPSQLGHIDGAGAVSAATTEVHPLGRVRTISNDFAHVPRHSCYSRGEESQDPERSGMVVPETTSVGQKPR